MVVDKSIVKRLNRKQRERQSRIMSETLAQYNEMVSILREELSAFLPVNSDALAKTLLQRVAEQGYIFQKVERYGR